MSVVPEAPPHLPPPLGSVPPLLKSSGVVSAICGTILLPGLIRDVLESTPGSLTLLQQNKLKTEGVV